MDSSSLSKTNAVLLIVSVVTSIWFLTNHETPADKAPAEAATPAPTPVRHCAPEGCFYLLNYVSVGTPRGPIGFEPGREVRFVKAYLEKQTLLVTDGRYDVEVSPRLLTNDMDVAELARNRDEAGQAQVAIYQERESQAYYAARQRFEMAHADRVHSADQTRIMGNRIGGNWRNPLNEPATAGSAYYGGYSGYQGISSSSPYSYFFSEPS